MEIKKNYKGKNMFYTETINQDGYWTYNYYKHGNGYNMVCEGYDGEC